MKRTLRPSIRIALETITIFLSVLMVSIDDFNLSALPLIAIIALIIFVNIKILKKF